MNNEVNNTRHEKSQSIAAELIDYVEIFVFSACAVLLIFSFFLRVCKVDGPSMNQTLTHGETIVHDGDISRTNKTTGNIGVTTSQQMLEQEIEVSAKLNVIKMIVESFKERFCILVY